MLSFLSLIIWGLVAVSGCQSRLQMPPHYSPSQPLPSATQLSGGRITTFIPRPGAADDPADKVLLAATRYIGLPGHVARSAVLEFTAGGHGQAEAHALIIGSRTLIIVGDVMRQGFGVLVMPQQKGLYARHNGQWIKTMSGGQLDLFSDPRSRIQLNPNSRKALVGRTLVILQYPVVWLHGRDKYLGDFGSGGQFVMTLHDLLTLFKLHDSALGLRKPTTITQVRLTQ